MKEVVEPIENYGLNPDLRPKMIFSRVGIVGFGEVGRTLAIIFASRGMEVQFIEVNEQKVKYGLEKLSEKLDKIINKWGMTIGEKRAILSRVKGAIICNDLAGCDLVIEAVHSKNRENSRTLRKAIFEKIESVVSPMTIIATNSTTIVITELSADMEHPERCVSMHIFTNISNVSVFEVVKGFHCSKETSRRLRIFSKLLGKKMIIVEESPGLISVRLLGTLINEACKMYLEGVGTMEEIDEMMRMGLNFPLGPFALADKIGLDKVLRWLDNMYNEFGEPAYKASPILKRLVRANFLGRRTGKGFYQYDLQGNTIKEFKLSYYN